MAKHKYRVAKKIAEKSGKPIYKYKYKLEKTEVISKKYKDFRIDGVSTTWNGLTEKSHLSNMFLIKDINKNN
jgi:hypothetical protein